MAAVLYLCFVRLAGIAIYMVRVCSDKGLLILGARNFYVCNHVCTLALIGLFVFCAHHCSVALSRFMAPFVI